MPKYGTILIIEDDPDDAAPLEKAFADAAVRNRRKFVFNSDEAITYLDGAGKVADRVTYPLPFLMIADLKTPDGHGFATLRWLAARPDLKKKIAVIALSSTCSDKEIEQAYELGARSFLPKPLAYADLVATVRELKEFWIDMGLTPGDANG